MRLDVALAARGLARSRSHARQLIDAGQVLVEGKPAKAGAQVDDATPIDVVQERYVSRGAHKLVRALESFHVGVSGRSALDVGASTGGFTQVLLEHGARHVTALDVGHDQFMLGDAVANGAVTLIEGTNIRDVRPGDISADIDLVAADVSFISLSFVFAPLQLALPAVRDWIVLVKPQFEVGKQRIGDGVVRDVALRRSAVASVVSAAREQGLRLRALTDSPITGAKGNVEYLAHFVPGNPQDATEWEAMFDTAEKGRA